MSKKTDKPAPAQITQQRFEAAASLCRIGGWRDSDPGRRPRLLAQHQQPARTAGVLVLDGRIGRKRQARSRMRCAPRNASISKTTNE